MKRKVIFICMIAILCVSGCLYVYRNVPLRTAIYRSFAKQTVYLLCENDTIYSFGYFGVRKSLINRENGEIKLLIENDDFCHNCFVGRLIGRSGVINGDYLYVAARSYLGGRYISTNKNYVKGKFLIMRKRDLHVIKEVPVDYSMIEAKIHGDNLVISGLQGFNVYNILDSSDPQLVYSYRTEEAHEYQGCDFLETDSCLYLAFARFDCGLSIYDITNPQKLKLVKDISIQDTLANGTVLPKGLHAFRLVVKEPYIVTTLAPKKEYFGTEADVRGLWICDVSNLNQIKKYVVEIPHDEYYSTVVGDPQPSHIALYNNQIYVNFCERGLAIFSMSDEPSNIEFVRTENFANGKMILPLTIDEKGWLFGGSFNNEKIYTYKTQ